MVEPVAVPHPEFDPRLGLGVCTEIETKRTAPDWHCDREGGNQPRPLPGSAKFDVRSLVDWTRLDA